MQNFSASRCTHRTAFCNHRHRPKTLPCRVLCPNEKRINDEFIRWQSFIKNPVWQKKKLTAAIFTHMKTSFKIIRENIFPSGKQKKKHRSKPPLLYGEKFPFCSGVFQNSLHLVYIRFYYKKIPLYNTEKNSSFVDVFLEIIFVLVLKFTRLSIAMLFVK